MPAAARLGDKAQVDADAHGCPACPHPGIGPIVTGSSDVFVNGKPAARQDDLGIHAVCCGPNNFTITKGSPTVYVNGKPMARMNDKTKHCGGTGPITEGSPDVLVDDGASASGLASYLIGKLAALLQNATADEKEQAKKADDAHDAGEPQHGSGDLAKDAQDTKQGAIVSARWALQRAANGQEVELLVECAKDAKGSLTIELWARSADRTQDKKVQSLDAQAQPSVKQKVKLAIPADAAATNESHFYFVVKDEQGAEKKSDMLFVDRAPFKFSV